MEKVSSKSLAKYFKNYLMKMALEVAEVAIYGSNIDSLKNAFDKLNASLKQCIDWENLTSEDCDNLGFGHWTSKEEVDNDDIPFLDKELAKGHITQKKYDEQKEKLYISAKIRLIPIYFADIIPNGITLYDIKGESFVYDKGNADKDMRCGMLAYGIIPKDLREDKD